MTLEQLRIFVTVAKTLNMRVAAERLCLTQPAVSAAVAALEAKYGIKLFDRIGRSLELNEMGRAFLPDAHRVLATMSNAIQTIEDISGLVRGKLRVVASQTVASYWLPQRLARFASHYPDIELELRLGNTAQATTVVLTGEADLGFVEGYVDEASLVREKVGSDGFGFYSAPGHSLTIHSLSRVALMEAQWVLREEGSGTRNHLETCLRTGFDLDLSDLTVRLVLPSNDAVMEAVSESELITAVSHLAAAPRVRAGIIQALDSTSFKRDFYMLRHRSRRMGRAAEAFLHFI
ncbi:LysR family transcriptional regulator [Gluconobacter morbifer]|uniref:LysR family transcriptional regulator n=1 Tax=Gluconobacter morbifer G707 TaxID=1088869 RepID=G6XEU0_9PROT|nr:LysR substrate-binding domain-containing protein [Gluconobacter morbifer]EHH68698.1 LysR family transcriptional regulator [Gluconobacter morbifer G707]